MRQAAQGVAWAVEGELVEGQHFVDRVEPTQRRRAGRSRQHTDVAVWKRRPQRPQSRRRGQHIAQAGKFDDQYSTRRPHAGILALVQLRLDGFQHILDRQRQHARR